MEPWIIAIAFVGGMVAGGMNTLAGFGSIITLSILMELMGLPANVANGTNRLTIIFASLTSTLTFYKHGKLDFKAGKLYFFVTILGALLGIYGALNVSNEDFKFIFKILIVLLFFVLLMNPKQLLREQSEKSEISKWILIPVFFILGIYGGFIQMGMGVFFIVAIVVLGRFNMVEGNAQKTFIVFAYTSVALAIFWFNGLVEWRAGVALAIGQGIGAWLTARFASKYESANLWAYRILLFIIVFVILYYFKVFQWLGSFL